MHLSPQDMVIDVRRDGDRGVSENPADHLQLRPLSEGIGRKEVA